MIKSLTGVIKELENNTVTLISSGIGFQVNVPDDKIFIKGQSIELSIYFHWNQETGPQLFGFISNQERNIFSLVIGCSGFGPKIGLTILNSTSPQAFIQAIMLSDIKALSSINGLGVKKAESMVLQLKDKVSKLSIDQVSTIANSSLHIIKEVNEALSSLNYTRAEINGALEFAKQNISLDKAPFDEILRKALSFLAKKR